jgi:hypothetical protein
VKCDHMNFGAEVDVHRLTDQAGVRVTGFAADVRIKCVDCGKRFMFLGLEPGVDTGGARVSIDGLEAHLGLCPAGMQPSALDRIAVHFPANVKH